MSYLTINKNFKLYIESVVGDITNKICLKNDSTRKEIKVRLLGWNDYSLYGCYNVLSYLIYMINEDMINCSKANFKKLLRAHGLICDLMYKN